MSPKLSILEVFDLVAGVFQFFGKSIQHRLGGLLGVKHSAGYGKNASMLDTAFFLRRFSPRQQMVLLGKPSTRPSYLKYCKDHGIAPNIEELRDGGSALWVGKKDAPDKVFVYLHGGGFHIGALKGHIQFIHSVILEAKKAGVSLSTVILEYGLAPENQYPKQHKQAISLFSHLFDSGIQPSQIIIGGESAGCILALGLLSHILHPNLEFPPLVELTSKIGGVILLSPWVTFDTTSESMKINAEHDSIFPDILDEWSSGYLGSQEVRNPYSEPCKAPEGWWNGLPGIVERVLVTVGAQEVMKDDLVAFVDVLRGVKGLNIELRLEEGIHAVPVHSCEENGPEGSILWSEQLKWVNNALTH